MIIKRNIAKQKEGKTLLFVLSRENKKNEEYNTHIGQIE